MQYSDKETYIFYIHTYHRYNYINYDLKRKKNVLCSIPLVSL